jgi:histidine kinase
MIKRLFNTRSLSFKLLIPVGVVIFLCILIWSHFSVQYQEKALIEKAVSDVDKFCNSVLNFTWFAMLHNPNEDMKDVLKSMSDHNEIERIRIFNSKGQIKFSNAPDEINSMVTKDDVACRTCHQNDPPVIKIKINDRIRMFNSQDDELLLGIINPILNKTDCSNSQCHYHPKNMNKIGILDVVVSLKNIREEIAFYKRMSSWTGFYLFATLGVTICTIIFFVVTNPINRLIKETHNIAKGGLPSPNNVLKQRDEIGKLSCAIQDMGVKIHDNQTELNKQKDLYRHLFEQVPCTITVQNKNYELLEFNQEFEKKFNPEYGDYCYSAYKDLNKKCKDCPVEKTFIDGKPHFSEESGINKDGSVSHWFVKTAPLKNEAGQIMAAMEMSIDISHKKQLEEKVKISEKKYQAIFKNIPNPVFILDKSNCIILDCNENTMSVYGYAREELKGKCFDIFFRDRDEFEALKANFDKTHHERLMNINKSGQRIYVNFWVSAVEFIDKNVLIVIAADITMSVETEQQLIQAGKMATLGEMATGVAHELNQPLSVIKTVSGFISKKIKGKKEIDPDILKTLCEEMESHVDRASKITNHMRLFGRKSVFKKETVNINDVLKRAFDIFSQQLKLREITVVWELDELIPEIQADSVRLEQVFINLLINARDAIVAKCKALDVPLPINENPEDRTDKKITIETSFSGQDPRVRIMDTGTGIRKSHWDKIFEPFFSTKKVGEGTGLGLSISYGILKEFGADISAYNNQDGGATFVITFHHTEKNV